MSSSLGPGLRENSVEILEDHKAALFRASETERIRYFQEWWGGLVVDGIYGPKTASALDRYIAGEFPLNVSRMLRAFVGAQEDVGVVEQPSRSNRGPEIDRWRTEIDLEQLGFGQWCALFISVHCTRVGIIIKSRGARGIVNELIALPRGREVDISDIGHGFVGICARKRGRKTHHVQIFRAFVAEGVLMAEHVGGNEKNAVRTKIQTAKKFFKGVVQVATYE